MSKKLLILYTDAMSAPILSFLITSVFIKQLTVEEYAAIVFVNAIISSTNFIHSGSISGIFSRRSVKRKNIKLLIIRTIYSQLIQFIIFLTIISILLTLNGKLTLVAIIALFALLIRRIEVSYFAFKVNQLVLPLLISRTICKFVVFITLNFIIVKYEETVGFDFIFYYLMEPIIVLFLLLVYFWKSLIASTVFNHRFLRASLKTAYCKNWRELIINGGVQICFWLPVFVAEKNADYSMVAGFGIFYLWLNINGLIVSTYCDFTYKKLFTNNKFRYALFYTFCTLFVIFQTIGIFVFGEKVVSVFFGSEYVFIIDMILDFCMFALIFFCMSRLLMRRVYQLGLERSNIWRILFAMFVTLSFSLLTYHDSSAFYQYYLVVYVLSFDLLGYITFSSLRRVFSVK